MKTKILIIGGGERAVMLLEALRGIKGIELAGVCDTSTDSVGMQYAKKLGIEVFVDFGRFMREKGADIIIDASGSSVFQEALKQVPPKSAKIVDSRTAELLFSIAQEKEKEVERMKSEFISTTSHELRTPLAAIKESVMLLIDGTTGSVSGKQGHFLKIAKRNIDRLATLINDLLDLSKIESGKMELKKTASDIEKAIKDALGPMHILAREKKLDLSGECEKGLPEVNCDPDKIRQVVVNLVSNAIKFTPEGGKVRVIARRAKQAQCAPGKRGEAIVVSVTDTGIGIFFIFTFTIIRQARLYSTKTNRALP